MPTLDPLRSSESLNTNKTQANTSKPKVAKSNENASTASQAPKQDAFLMSKQGKMMNKITQKLAQEPAFDKTKVAALKAEIANGSYKVDANKLAKKMLNFEQGLKKNS